MKKNNGNNIFSIHNTCSFGCTNKEEAMKKYTLIMVATLVATLALMSTPVWAQDSTPPADDSSQSDPTPPADDSTQSDPASSTNIFDDASVLWNESADDLGYNMRLFAQGTKYARENAPGAMKGMIDRNVRKKSERSSLKTEVERFFETIASIFEPLAPTDFTNMRTQWEAHVTTQGCDLGTTESPECQTFYEKSKRIREALMESVTDEELKAVPNGFVTIVSDDYRADTDLGTKDNYAMLALMEQAAIFSLPTKYWNPLVMDANRFPGDEVTLGDLVDKHGGQVTLMCIGEEVISYELSGETNADILILGSPNDRKQVKPAKLATCRIFYTKSSLTPFEEAKVAVANSNTSLRGDDLLLAYDPEMIKGKLLTIYREGVDTMYDVEPENVTNDGFNVGNDTFTAAEYGVTYIVTIREKSVETTEPDRKAILAPELGYGMQFGVGGSIEDTSFQTMTLGVIFNPFDIGDKSVLGSRGSLKFRLALGALQIMKGYNPSYTTESPSNGERWDFYGEFGIMGGVRFTKWFELSLSANLAWSTGGPGFTSDLLARFWVHDHVELFIGPEFSYLQLNTKALGDNNMMPDNDKLNELEVISLGWVAGITFPF